MRGNTDMRNAEIESLGSFQGTKFMFLWPLPDPISLLEYKGHNVLALLNNKERLENGKKMQFRPARGHSKKRNCNWLLCLPLIFFLPAFFPISFFSVFSFTEFFRSWQRNTGGKKSFGLFIHSFESYSNAGTFYLLWNTDDRVFTLPSFINFQFLSFNVFPCNSDPSLF